MRLTLILFIMSFVPIAHPEVFKCFEASQTIFTDRPCSTHAIQEQVTIRDNTIGSAQEMRTLWAYSDERLREYAARKHAREQETARRHAERKRERRHAAHTRNAVRPLEEQLNSIGHTISGW